MLVAYSATSRGEGRVAKLLDLGPELVRGCPTFQDLPISRTERSALLAGLKSYAERTEHPHCPLGYGDTGAALVFEHGCPDNVPVIFWAEAAVGKTWDSVISRPVCVGGRRFGISAGASRPPSSRRVARGWANPPR